jgi:hypothetical protein
MKPINVKNLSPTLKLVERHDGFWLWDDTRKMNLSIRTKSEIDALVEAITYYQNRLRDIEQKYNDLSTKVDSFVEQFVSKDEDEY